MQLTKKELESLAAFGIFPDKVILIPYLISAFVNMGGRGIIFVASSDTKDPLDAFLPG